MDQVGVTVRSHDESLSAEFFSMGSKAELRIYTPARGATKEGDTLSADAIFPTSAHVLCAATRYLHLDAAAANSLASNGRITIPLPAVDPHFRSRVRATPKVLDDYRYSRPGAAEMISPILMSQPQEFELKAYQLTGIARLLSADRLILADDMGLGKTAQAISAMSQLIADCTVTWVLVICPKSLLKTWQHELAIWAPRLTSLIMTPSLRIKEQAWRTAAGRFHVLITNYEQLRDPPGVLLENNTDLIVADEAHRLRKTSAQVVRGVRKIRFRRFWALTGTPIERNQDDLVTLLSVIEPERFGPRDIRLAPRSIRAQASRYILRRLKEDVLTDLPTVMNRRERLELSPSQSRVYNKIIRDTKQAGGDKALAAITKLRRVCDIDPATGSSSKLDRIIEILELVHLNGEKAVIFSTYLDPLFHLERRLKSELGQGTRLLVGSMSMEERGRALRDFAENPEVSNLLCSSKVGSEGLTLTAANHVVFINEWWNPSANAQARDRVVRIGQIRPVTVWTFVCDNTIEDKLDEILTQKSEIFSEIIDRLASDVRLQELSDEARRAIKSLLD